MADNIEWDQGACRALLVVVFYRESVLEGSGPDGMRWTQIGVPSGSKRVGKGVDLCTSPTLSYLQIVKCHQELSRTDLLAVRVLDDRNFISCRQERACGRLSQVRRYYTGFSVMGSFRWRVKKNTPAPHRCLWKWPRQKTNRYIRRCYPMQENPPPEGFQVGCSSPIMRLAEHLTALRAWGKQCLPDR